MPAAPSGGATASEGWGDASADYELLELVLHLVTALKNAKPLAQATLREFGSISGVFAVRAARREQADGLGATSVAHVKVFQAAAARFGRDRIENEKPILPSWTQLINYCHSQMAFKRSEHFRVLFLDKKNCLLAERIQQTGTVNHAPFYPREVIERSLELSASALILVHNHPKMPISIPQDHAVSH